MKITKIISDYLDSNVYILERNNHCLIIDCGAELESIKNIVKSRKVKGILLTHGHYDHSINCNEYAKCFDAKIYANKDVIKTLSDKNEIYSEDNSIINDFSRFIFLEKDECLIIGEFKVNCFSTPGHSPCCECYLIEDLLFCGDVLFENGIGRTDLKNSNKSAMVNTLERLDKIEFKVCLSGHGNESDIEKQKINIKLYKKFLTR